MVNNSYDLKRRMESDFFAENNIKILSSSNYQVRYLHDDQVHSAVWSHFSTNSYHTSRYVKLLASRNNCPPRYPKVGEISSSFKNILSSDKLTYCIYFDHKLRDTLANQIEPISNKELITLKKEMPDVIATIKEIIKESFASEEKGQGGTSTEMQKEEESNTQGTKDATWV